MIKKLAYSLGAVATALSYQAFSTYIIFFYVDVKKMPVQMAAMGMLIFAVWNAINDPVAGFVSDSTRSRFGKRIPYLLAGAIPFGALYYLLWVPPFSGVTQVGLLFIYFVSLICLFDGFYTVTILNWAALFPEMFQSLSERAEVNSLRQSFGMLGLLFGIALPPLIYSSIGWGWMGAIFGAIISSVLFIAIWGSREKKEYRLDKPLPFFGALKATLQNRSFLTFVFANLFVQYAFTIILATIPFFAKYALDAAAEQITMILGAAFLTAIPMLFVWKRLMVRVGAKYCFMASMAVLSLALTPLFFVKSFGPVLLTSGLIGVGIAGFILTADVIISDVIDEDEVNTGTRREGMFFGMNAFVTRFAIGLEALSMSAVFILSGYNPYVFSQSRAFLAGLRILLAGLPALALLIGLCGMLFYPLSGVRLGEMREKLAGIHAKKLARQGEEKG